MRARRLLINILCSLMIAKMPCLALFPFTYDVEHPDNSKWITAGLVGLGALGGGIIIGEAIKSGHHSKSNSNGSGTTGATGPSGATGAIGPTGSTGPSFATVDESLEFTINADAPDMGEDFTSYTFTAFVTQPDGTIVTAAPAQFVFQGSLTPEPIITIGPPVQIGTYSVGFRVEINDPQAPQKICYLRTNINAFSGITPVDGFTLIDSISTANDLVGFVVPNGGAQRSSTIYEVPFTYRVPESP